MFVAACIGACGGGSDDDPPEDPECREAFDYAETCDYDTSSYRCPDEGDADEAEQCFYACLLAADCEDFSSGDQELLNCITGCQ